MRRGIAGVLRREVEGGTAVWPAWTQAAVSDRARAGLRSPADNIWLSETDLAIATGSGIDASHVAAGWVRSGGDPVRMADGLAGAFAVALHDRSHERLVLIRDRIGERPLYYAATQHVVAFASDLATLRGTGVPGASAILPEALDAYLAFNYIPAPLTIHPGILRVRAGHVVTIDLRALGLGSPTSVQEIRYWDLPERSDVSATPTEMLERLEEALARRLPRGPVAALFLSGGLDSGLVGTLIRRAGIRLSTFSVRFADAELDESARARSLAARMEADHHEVPLDSIDPALFEKVIDGIDEPFGDPACLPTWLLAREAGVGNTVAMTGDGSDALLAGDHWFRRIRRLDRLRAVGAGPRGAVAMIASLAGGREGRRLGELAAWAALHPADAYLRMRERWREEERTAIYSGPIRAAVSPPGDRDKGTTSYRTVEARWTPGRFLDAAMRIDALHNLPDGLLMKVERMGRPHGIECRSPFVDREFAEWAARLDTRLLVKGRSGKHLLRRASELILPREMANVRKQGLMVPTGRWLRGSLRELAEAAFSEELIARQGIFEETPLRALKECFDAGSNDARLTGQVWQIVVFQTWWRKTMATGRS